MTFLVGENGSGKSTMVEAIAGCAGLDAQGGRSSRKYGNTRSRTPLGELMDLKWTPAGFAGCNNPVSDARGSSCLLSFQSCLSLVQLFHRLGEAGAQIV